MKYIIIILILSSCSTVRMSYNAYQVKKVSHKISDRDKGIYILSFIAGYTLLPTLVK